MQGKIREHSKERMEIINILSPMHLSIYEEIKNLDLLEKEYRRSENLLKGRKNAKTSEKLLKYDLSRAEGLQDAANRRFKTFDTKRRLAEQEMLRLEVIVGELFKSVQNQKEKLEETSVSYFILARNFMKMV